MSAPIREAQKRVPHGCGTLTLVSNPELGSLGCIDEVLIGLLLAFLRLCLAIRFWTQGLNGFAQANRLASGARRAGRTGGCRRARHVTLQAGEADAQRSEEHTSELQSRRE